MTTFLKMRGFKYIFEIQRWTLHKKSTFISVGHIYIWRSETIALSAIVFYVAVNGCLDDFFCGVCTTDFIDGGLLALKLLIYLEKVNHFFVYVRGDL